MIGKLLTTQHLEFLSLKGGCRGSPESTHVKMPHYWKSHATAQIFIFLVQSLDLNINSASTRENLSSGVCEQQRHRLACAYAQFDQRLCYSLNGQVWYLIVSFPDLCNLTYFATSEISIF